MNVQTLCRKESVFTRIAFVKIILPLKIKILKYTFIAELDRASM